MKKAALLIAFLCPLFLCSQNIKSRIKAEIIYDSVLSMPNNNIYPFKMHVNNELTFDNQTGDTLKLSALPPMVPSRQVGIQKIDVTMDGQKLNYKYNRNCLIIPLPKTNSTISIAYDIWMPHLMQFNIDNNFFIEMFIQDDASWYFVGNEVSLVSMEITIPSGTTLFTGVRKNQIGPHSYLLDITDHKDINMAILKDKFYDFHSLVRHNVKYKVYMPNTESFGKDMISKEKKEFRIFSEKKYNKKSLKSRLKNYRESIGKVCAFFDVKDTMQLNVVECYWGLPKKGAFGRCFGNFMLVDTSFYKGPGFTHEFIHMVDPLTDYYPTADSVRFLFSESLIEYLAQYIFYKKNPDGREYINNYRMAYYTQKKHEYTSIFQIKENNPEAQSIIYSRTPFVLRAFGLRIGEPLFIKCIKDFYKTALEKKEVLVEDFKQALLSNGVKDEDVDELFKML